MGATETPVEVSLVSTENEHQALMILLSNDYKDLFRYKARSLFFSQNTVLFTEVRKFLRGSNTYLHDEMALLEASSRSLLLVVNDSKTPQKNKDSSPDSSKSPKRK